MKGVSCPTQSSFLAKSAFYITVDEHAERGSVHWNLGLDLCLADVTSLVESSYRTPGLGGSSYLTTVFSWTFENMKLRWKSLTELSGVKVGWGQWQLFQVLCQLKTKSKIWANAWEDAETFLGHFQGENWRRKGDRTPLSASLSCEFWKQNSFFKKYK